MSVKVSLNEVSKAQSFPKLMISDELIIFFIRLGVGIVINSEGDYELGDFGESFKMEYFKDYQGEVTLKNE